MYNLVPTVDRAQQATYLKWSVLSITIYTLSGERRRRCAMHRMTPLVHVA